MASRAGLARTLLAPSLIRVTGEAHRILYNRPLATINTQRTARIEIPTVPISRFLALSQRTTRSRFPLLAYQRARSPSVSVPRLDISPQPMQPPTTLDAEGGRELEPENPREPNGRKGRRSRCTTTGPARLNKPWLNYWRDGRREKCVLAHQRTRRQELHRDFTYFSGFQL